MQQTMEWREATRGPSVEEENRMKRKRLKEAQLEIGKKEAKEAEKAAKRERGDRGG